MTLRSLLPVVFVAVAALIGSAQATLAVDVLPRADIRFQPLNPLRGDASPKAGVLWGDIRTGGAAGALIEFVGGFSSPPHIHNITYRAVVISGAVHNDDPEAEAMWMGPGSFWTQPAGEVHITAAGGGKPATAFLEILEGPYLVQPSREAFDNGERPVNIDARNLVWLRSSDVTWLARARSADAAEDPQVAFLWGSPRDGQRNGTFLKLPGGYRGELRGNGSWLRAVVIQGQARHGIAGASDGVTLEPGSYFGSQGDAAHRISCESDEACLIYLSTTGQYIVVAT